MISKYLIVLISRLEGIIRWIGKGISWLNPLLVLLIIVDVFVRYFLSESAAWISEVEWHLFSLMFLLGGAYTLQEDQHVRVDVLFQNWSPRQQALTNLIGHSLLVIPLCLFLIPPAWDYFLQSWQSAEESGDAGGLKALYPIKLAIPLAFILLFAQSGAESLKSLLLILTPSQKIHA